MTYPVKLYEFEAELAEICRRGERPPANRASSTFKVRNHIKRLVEMGRLEVRLYNPNFRQIVFVDGPFKGLKSQRPPRREKPWRVITRRTIGDPRFRTKSFNLWEPLAPGRVVLGGFDDAEYARKLAGIHEIPYAPEACHVAETGVQPARSAQRGRLPEVAAAALA